LGRFYLKAPRPGLRHLYALFLFVIFVVFLELGFFFAKQFLDPLTLCGIEGDFEHCPIVLNVLSYDETLHRSPPPVGRAPHLS
jgi:hypothetical protein